MFFDILLNNSIAWLFSVLTFGIHSLIVVFGIIISDKEFWQIYKNHYLFEFASLLLIPLAVLIAIVKYIRDDILFQPVKLYIKILFISYLLLVLAAFFESNFISNL